MSDIVKANGSGPGEIARAGVETLTEAYIRLQEVRAEHAGFLVTRAEKVDSLDARARYVLGSLEAARKFLGDSSAADSAKADDEHVEVLREEEGAVSGSLPAKAEADDPLADMVAKTKAELDGARASLDEWAGEQEDYFEEAFAAVEGAVIDRTAAYAEHHRPALKLEVARVGGGRCIVHVPRPGDDEAVILCRLFAGRPPSRHDFISDDSVDEVDGPVHLTVREHGIDPAEITAGGPDAEDRLVRETARRLLPIRAHLPLLIQRLSWPRMRLMTRGPVLELQARGEGGEYTHILSAEESELFTGYVLSLRARGLLEVDIVVP